jgi:hypothetical protein
MSGELEAAGAMATAGLVGAAIEGRAGHGPGDGKCLNCGAELQGAFCHGCGQTAHVHRSLAHMVEEFLHGIIHFDTKAWRTLPMVMFRPGTLTRNYIYGKRARYISPLALFLFTIFFMFAVFAFTGGPAPDIDIDNASTRAEAVTDLEEARAEQREAEVDLADAIANPDPDQPAGLEERLGRMQVRLAEEEVARRETALARIDQALARHAAGQAQEGGVTVSETPDGLSVTQSTSNSLTRAEALSRLEAARAEQTQAEAALANALANPDPDQPAGLEERLGRMQVRLAEEEVRRRETSLARVDDALARHQAGTAQEDGVSVSEGEEGLTVTRTNGTWQEQLRRSVSEGDITVNLGSEVLNHRVIKKLENPDLALYSIKQAAYKFSFLLVPISLPFIWLLFLWKRGLTLYDHTVYALYALCFASLLFVLVAFAANGAWTKWAVPWLVLGALPVHTFFHLKGAYALGWWSALWRTAFMLTFAMVALAVFILAIVLLGLTG